MNGKEKKSFYEKKKAKIENDDTKEEKNSPLAVGKIDMLQHCTIQSGDR